MSVARILAAVTALALAGCGDPPGPAEAEAERIAEAVAPGAMRVTGSTSNMMRDAGRTVSLRYEADGYDFPVVLDLGELGCASEAGGCEGSVRRQITRWREAGDVERALQPALDACGIKTSEAPRVVPRTPSADLAERNFNLEIDVAAPLVDGDGGAIATAETCGDALQAAHAAGPASTQPLYATFKLRPAVPLPVPEGAEKGDPAEVRYTLALWPGARQPFTLNLPYAWRTALGLAWRQRGMAHLEAVGTPMDVSGTSAGRLTPLPGEPTTVRATVFATAATAPANSRATHIMCVTHDLRAGTTRFDRMIGVPRKPDGLLDVERIDALCAAD